MEADQKYYFRYQRKSSKKIFIREIFLVLYAEGIYITLKEKDGSVNLRRWGSQRSLKKN